MVDFSSNDYLSLTLSHDLRRRFINMISSSSSSLFGSTGSRLLDGTTTQHLALECRLASFFGSQSALLFGSGWDANVSFFSTVPQSGDWILFDELIHASVWDGMRSSRVSAASRKAIKHNDLHSLKAVVEDAIYHKSWKSRDIATTSSTSPSVIYIAVESLYSMDGDLACLPQMIDTVKQVIEEHPQRLSRSQVCFVVDEAHTTGVYGRQGRGFVDELGTDVRECVDVRLMTFGKGVGSQGAVLLSSTPIREFLINYARPFIFSTAMSVLNVLAIECAWDVLQSEEGDDRRRRLGSLCDHFSKSMATLASHSPTHLISLLPPSHSPLPRATATPIQPILTPQPHALAEYLQSLGYLVRPVVYPTVPKGLERVRVCLHTANEEVDLDGLVEGVAKWVEGVGPAKARL